MVAVAVGYYICYGHDALALDIDIVIVIEKNILCTCVHMVSYRKMQHALNTILGHAVKICV